MDAFQPFPVQTLIDLRDKNGTIIPAGSEVFGMTKPNGHVELLSNLQPPFSPLRKQNISSLSDLFMVVGVDFTADPAVTADLLGPNPYKRVGSVYKKK